LRTIWCVAFWKGANHDGIASSPARPEEGKEYLRNENRNKEKIEILTVTSCDGNFACVFRRGFAFFRRVEIRAADNLFLIQLGKEVAAALCVLVIDGPVRKGCGLGFIITILENFSFQPHVSFLPKNTDFALE
jgi:hypothetical protein